MTQICDHEEVTLPTKIALGTADQIDPLLQENI